MFLRKVVVSTAFLAFVVGCSTIRNAHEAQQEMSGRETGQKTGERPAKVNLRGYSLERLVDFAMTNRPTVVAARLAVEDARLNLKTVAADAPLLSSTPWTAPKLALGGNYGASSDASATRLGWHTEGSAAAALSLDLLIWDFGRNAAEAEAAAEGVIAAEQELVREGYAVFDDVATAYFAVLEADALLEVRRTNEFNYAEHLRQAENRLSAGEAQRLDVTRARLDLSRAREETVAASNLVMTAGAGLMRALGIDAEGGSRDDVLLPLGNSLEAVMQGFAATTFTVDEAFALARTNAPAVAVARARLRAASDRVDAAIADLLPSVSASASLNWTDPLWLWKWGFSASQSLFTGFRKTTAVDRSVVAMKSAAAAVDEAEQNLSLSVELAVAERDNAVVARTTAWESVKSARENYATVKEQYREGDVSRIDFTTAVSDLATAVGNCIRAYYRGQVAEAKLFSIVGRVPVYSERKITEAK